MRPARWLQNHPHILEKAYQLTSKFIQAIEPLLRAVGFTRLNALFEWGERILKGPLFDCQMCGVCNLRGTGMTCPMTCPKEIRNGPCGGVRADGKCEVIPEMDCIWVLAWQRASQMPTYGDRIMRLHEPLDYSLHDSSAWLNMLEGYDDLLPPHWQIIPLQEVTIIHE